MAEKHKQQVVLRPPPAEPGPNGAYLQEEAQRLLQSCLSGNTGSLTEEDRKALHMVRLVVAELEAAVEKPRLVTRKLLSRKPGDSVCFGRPERHSGCVPEGTTEHLQRETIYRSTWSW